MFSFWERESFLQKFDVVVLGSGIVGLTAALHLREQLGEQARIAVVERGALPEGASTKNAGFACFGSLTELIDDFTRMTENEVFALVEKRWRGLQRLRQRIGDVRMRYEPLGGYEIFKTTEGGIFEDCKNRIAYFNEQIGKITNQANTYQIKNNSFGFQQVLPQVIWNSAEGQIHTGETMRHLLALVKSNNIFIFNGLNVLKIEDETHCVCLHTEGGDLWTQKLIVANNGFARRLMPDLEVVPARNQVLVTKPLQNLPFKGSFHYDKGYFYFRNIGENRILFGGGRNLDIEAEATDEFGLTQKIQDALLAILQNIILPTEKAEVAMWWSGIMGVGSVKKPIIQHVSPNVVVAVRMGGMGVAIGSLVGEEAAHLLLK